MSVASCETLAAWLALKYSPVAVSEPVVSLPGAGGAHLISPLKPHQAGCEGDVLILQCLQKGHCGFTAAAAGSEK